MYKTPTTLQLGVGVGINNFLLSAPNLFFRKTLFSCQNFSNMISCLHMKLKKTGEVAKPNHKLVHNHLSTFHSMEHFYLSSFISHEYSRSYPGSVSKPGLYHLCDRLNTARECISSISNPLVQHVGLVNFVGIYLPLGLNRIHKINER